MTRLKDIALINKDALPDDTDYNLTFDYIDIGSVDSLGRIRSTETMRFGDAPSRARRLVGEGETIVSTVRTYLRAIAYVGPEAKQLVISTGFATVKPRLGIHPRFLYWALRSNTFIEDVVARSVGVSYPAITATELSTLPISVPPLDEQVRVARHLDLLTQQIDDLFEEQRGARGLLQRRSWVLFSELVLDAATRQVPMRRLLKRVADGPFGSAFSSGDYSDDGAAVVRLGNIGFAEYKSDDQAFIPLQLYKEFSRHHVRSGDLLIAGLGDSNNHAGRACVAPDLGPAMVKGKCFVATVDPAVVSAQFLAFYLSCPIGRDAIGEAARGSTRTMINLEITKSSIVRLPSLESQQDMVATMTEAQRVQNQLTSEIDQQIALLGAHREALITAATSGRALEAASA